MPCEDLPCVAILGTCDTKLDELLYVRSQLLEAHRVRVKLFDVGRTPSPHPAIDVARRSILTISKGDNEPTSGTPPDVSTLSRAAFISTMASRATPLLASLATAGTIHGLVALGGSGGSALASAVMRQLPLGFPKLLVSTMAAGDVRAFVGEADIAMLYSVVDIAGLNDILCPVLDNAAGAIAGMARAYQTTLRSSQLAVAGEGANRTRKRIAITMFGVTTPAVTVARALLARYACDSYVFHATGAGGRAMERLVSEGFFDGVLDLTTTELADELVGGILSAGPHRLEAAARAGVPQVVSLGALDIVSFGPRASVPERFVLQGRILREHNACVTNMRTTPEECAQLGRMIAEKLRAAGARPDRTEVWLPMGGMSLLDKHGGPFWDPEAVESLARAVREGFKGDGDRKVRVVEAEGNINDSTFVEGMVQSLIYSCNVMISVHVFRIAM
ncbi:UPF0261 domain protein [Trametes versicolor FP-101664 SS1]|uniref:UPF0261 domain protein n=1 Tax=Trametes versicolor (strain FP-101664) TaxID=717944 RepID=UPI0004623AE9|nr:UPF0261 domain protein [Trametes versicolor FP-101664 SS1]EIW60037.1 UPF0261 domain protein [Trametes versicolor FP-101664 SS1]